ncbi:helix-turn-helix domain-containing protein [Spirosoma rhododendri]|uniref:Helix-turn-helix transcriptional regulator n=1 Tax=Spirosoma rhododendri TaxID=2728024 RepID=A0A7L5DPY3_9BACT|nr:response regulator transcription factor [Spirosoma rhododendri]QJD80195.1 helix-turn-helix transcriptional regulator [Spirosoma rhododendri]
MQSLPIRLDVFALAILLGIVQGIFLGLFLLTGTRGKDVANRCLGWFTLVLVAIISEIFLNYTNYTFRLLWTVDLAEPVNFTVGPLFYFFVYSRLHKRLPRSWGWHLVPFAIWLLNAVTWIDQPLEFRYNSYTDAWHPELPRIAAEQRWPEDFTDLRPYVSEITALSCVVYALLSLLVMRRAVRQRPELTGSPVLRPLWLMSGLFALVPILIALVNLVFDHDLGDHLLASYVTLSIYVNTFLLLRGSAFFQPLPQPVAGPAEPKKKYEKSALSEEVEAVVLQKLTRLMDDEKLYLRSDLSLPKLADQLNTSPHHLSQLLNDRLQKSFFDLLADYRVREAQTLLTDPLTTNLKIDEIAERVGYNSTSAFHTAFKRLTGQTPAQFRQLTAYR